MALYQFVMKQTLVGQEIRNVLNYDVTLDASDSLQDVGDAIADSWRSRAAQFSDEWRLYGFDVYDLAVARPRVPQSFTVQPTIITGTATDGVMPTNLAVIIRWIGANPVVPNRGRTFISGFTKLWSSGDTGQLNSTGQAQMIGLAADLQDVTTTNGSTAQLQICRLPASGVPSVVNPVGNHFVPVTFSSLRKRKIGVGQ